MGDKVKSWFDRKFPITPEGVIGARDKLIAGLKALGVFVVGWLSYFVEQIYAALPQLKAMIAPYVGQVGVWIVAALVIYLAEQSMRRRTGPPMSPGSRPPGSPPHTGPVPPVTPIPPPAIPPASQIPPVSNEVKQ